MDFFYGLSTFILFFIFCLVECCLYSRSMIYHISGYPRSTMYFYNFLLSHSLGYYQHFTACLLHTGHFCIERHVSLCFGVVHTHLVSLVHWFFDHLHIPICVFLVFTILPFLSVYKCLLIVYFRCHILCNSWAQSKSMFILFFCCSSLCILYLFHRGSADHSVTRG